VPDLRSKLPKYIAVVALYAVALYVPFGVEQRNWLTPLNLAMAAAVGAIGLNILLGFAGQLSLAHPFFVAVGAYGYSYFSSGYDPITKSAAETDKLSGMSLHPLLSTVVVLILAAALGALFSPIAGRVKGIYLGIASLGLVFLTDHLLQNVKGVSGGFNGRRVPVYDVGFTTIERCRPKECVVNGVPFGQPEKLWYLLLVVVTLSFILARNMMRGRPGRALQALRDGETPASVMGVNLVRYRASAFMVSAMFAAMSGVMYALANGNITPAEFSVDSSVAFLAMVVIGGLGSLGGSIVGALFVRILPDLITRHGEKIPFVAAPDDPSGLKPLAAARFIYGATIIVLLLFEDGGLAGLMRRMRNALSRLRTRDRPNISSAASLATVDP
jgi:branched-chain amino acid transport system permease protein